MIDAAVETGQRNLAALEQTAIKDNTLLPGEWYGGQLQLGPRRKWNRGKSLSHLNPGRDEIHDIDVAQEPNKG